MAQAGGAAEFCGDGLLVCVRMLSPPQAVQGLVTMVIPGVLIPKKNRKKRRSDRRPYRHPDLGPLVNKARSLDGIVRLYQQTAK
jgi:hypothetical protein